MNKNNKPGRAVELRALLGWILDSWRQAAGSTATWEQRAGKLELAWKEALREAGQAGEQPGSPQNASRQQETQSAGGSQ